MDKMGNIGESPNSALNVRDGPTCQSLYLLERLYVDVLALVTLVLGFSAKVAKAVSLTSVYNRPLNRVNNMLNKSLVWQPSLSTA